jgi:phage terminase large subunit
VRLSELVNPTSKQRDFLDALFGGIFKFILYGGAAGGGKSYILRWAAVLFLVKAYAVHGVKNCMVGLFCEDFPALKARQVSKIETEFPKWLGEIKNDEKIGRHYRLAERFGGGIILLCNLDEPSKYDSVEFAAIFVDELTKNKVDIFDELRKRLRWKRVWGQPHFPCGGVCADPRGVLQKCDKKDHEREFIHPFAAATNPGGDGHTWVKDLWINKLIPKNLIKWKHQFCYVKALASDNPFNPASYYEDLKSLGALMAKAYAEGDWDLFVGMFFSEFRETIHVIEPFVFPKWWKKGWGGDWGFNDHFAGEACAVNDVGDVFFYKELYVREKTADVVGQKLVTLHAGESFADKVLSPDAFSKQPGRDYADQMAKAGWNATKADNDRINGWMIMRQYMAWEKDEDEVLVKPPKMYIMKSGSVGQGQDYGCPNLIRTLPGLVFDKNKKEDCSDDSEDHAPDAARYIMKQYPALAKIPLESFTNEWQEAALRAEMRNKKQDQEKWTWQ